MCLLINKRGYYYYISFYLDKPFFDKLFLLLNSFSVCDTLCKDTVHITSVGFWLKMKIYIFLLIIGISQANETSFPSKEEPSTKSLSTTTVGITQANETSSPSKEEPSTKSLSTTDAVTTQLPLMTLAGAKPMSTNSLLLTTTVKSGSNSNLSEDNANANDRSILGIVGTKNAVNLEEKAMTNTPVDVKLNQRNTDGTFKRNSKDTGNNKNRDRTNCNVKNSKCVPTREELIAAGVSNPEMMQHKINVPLPELEVKEVPNSNINRVDANSNKPKCNVKNSTCVPTREELIAAGESNPDRMQHKINVPQPELEVKEVPNSIITAIDANLNKPKCNVKNNTCVPTREELIAAGESNPGMMQHRLSGPLELEVKEVTNNNITAVDANSNKPKCNVKNSTCVPTEKELLASGIDMSGLRQFSIDTENVFLGQNDQSDSKVIKDTIAETLTRDSLSSSQATVSGIASGTGKTNPKQIEGALVKESIAEITEAMKPTTMQQIPVPSKTTQQTKEAVQTTASSVLETPKQVVSNIASLKTNEKGKQLENTAGLITSTMTSKMTSTDSQAKHQTTELYTCPTVKCRNTCVYERKVNSNGCQTCECKFSNSCPRVTPVSRLLCLLRANTSQSCTSNADCRRNRICCPGTCGPICRRPSRSRSMLLSMLVD
ncbi:uncharacterized protein LOC132721367 [Ruditapes philippinarum]|uniref:uncharacterized protein LOC132721367 n=1 Tax=Ruditapes philippinarum TaxID=129788 RepID=UPI00295C1B74|nr:uncharacterized protein LOC132721367 [Ruditapes philippinarum]